MLLCNAVSVEAGVTFKGVDSVDHDLKGGHPIHMLLRSHWI
jgi:hypothetical protein